MVVMIPQTPLALIQKNDVEDEDHSEIKREDLRCASKRQGLLKRGESVGDCRDRGHGWVGWGESETDPGWEIERVHDPQQEDRSRTPPPHSSPPIPTDQTCPRNAGRTRSMANAE